MSSVSTLIADRFSIVKEIGHGSFSTVYLATDTLKNRECALKIENNEKTAKTLLDKEVLIYNHLKKNKGVPKIYWLGKHEDKNVMAMELLGPSLNSLLEKHKKFSIRTVCTLADQILKKIAHLHNEGFIHRDLKPANFVIGNKSQNKNELYIIDYGLAKKYETKKSTTKKFVGTLRFASMHAHSFVDQCRKDDLEAIGYVLTYLLRGDLPWSLKNTKTKEEKNTSLFKEKVQWKEKGYRTLPQPIEKYMSYVYSLGYNDKPDYNFLRGLFKDYARKQESLYDSKVLHEESK